MTEKSDEQQSGIPSDEATDEPTEETAPESPEQSQETAEEPTEKKRSLFEGFKSRADKFVREHFKGEYVEQPVGSKVKEISKAVGSGLLGAAASIGGIKSFADIPRWFLQKYYTKQERQRIKDAMNFASADESVDGKMNVGDEVLYVNQDGDTETGWVILDKSEDGRNASIRKGDDERHIGMGVSINELLPAEHQSPLEQKKQRLEKAINESKYLEPEKKQELLQKLQDTVETYETEVDELEVEKNEKIAKLLDEAIQTRVKGTTALKEALNTALIGTGLATLRGLGYGAVALLERGVKVAQEMEKGERTESFAKELVVNGFKETWNDLRDIRGIGYGAVALYEHGVKVAQEIKKGERTGDSVKEMITGVFKDTWNDLRLKGRDKEIKQAANFGKAIGTIARFAGFAGLAAGEWTGEGGISGSINKALEAFEKKGALQAASDNYEAQFDRVVKIASFGQLGGVEGGVGAEETGVAKAEAPAVAGEMEAGMADAGTPAVAAEAGTAEAVVPGVATADGTAESAEAAEVHADAEAPVEATPERAELSKDEIEAGTVRKGDGIIRLVQRQLKLNPEKYGYDGNPDDKKAIAGWVRKTAFAATKQAGFVNQDGWMGVSGKAIDHMALGVRSEGGELKLDFYDAKTGESMSLDDLQEKKFIYDYQKPEEYEEFEPESDYELFEDEPVAEAVVEPTEGVPDTDDAPAPIEHAEIVRPEGGIGLRPTSVDAELPVLTGDEPVVPASGSSVEAPVDAGTTEPETPPAASVEESVPETESAKTPVESVKVGGGKITFKHEDGRVVSAIADYKSSSDELEKAAGRFAVTEREVYNAYISRVPDDQMWRANAPAGALMRKMEQETRVETALKEMEKLGQKDTDEYKFLKRQAGALKGVIKRAFKQLDLDKKLERWDSTLLGGADAVVSDAAVAEVAPVARPATPELSATEPPTVEAPTKPTVATPDAEATPEETLEKSAGELEFASDYTAEEREKIAAYINSERLTNQELQKQLQEYQNKYGDRGNFGAFKLAVEQKMDQRNERLADIMKQIADGSTKHPEINFESIIKPEEAAAQFARAQINIADRTSELLTIPERAANSQAEFQSARDEL